MGIWTADFDSMMFSYNYWIDDPGNQKHPEGEEIFGSFRDYWDQMSKGKLKIVGRVVNPTDENGVPEWLTANFNRQNYLGVYAGATILGNEAIQKALSEGYISNTPGHPNYYDNLVIIYAQNPIVGPSNNVGGYPNTNWYIVGEQMGRNIYGQDRSFTHIGLHLNSFGVNMGFFDGYIDPFYPNPTKTWNFDLMNAGWANGPLRKGECAATLAPYFRIEKGWVEPITIIKDTNNFLVEYNYQNPNLYKIVPIVGPRDMHYLFEVRKRTGFDLYIPEAPATYANQSGTLLIWQHNAQFWFDGVLVVDKIRLKQADYNNNIFTQLNDFFPSENYNNFQSLNDITLPAASIGAERDEFDPKYIQPAHFALTGIQKLANGNTIIGEIKLNHAIIKNNIPGNWQLVSVGAIVPNFSAGVVFPTSITPIYKYIPGIGYVVVNNLENGPGYWAKFGSSQSLIHSGFTLEYLSIGISSGWNIIGSISDKVPLANVYTIPPGIISGIFRYENGYVPLTGSDSVKPGVGYWLSSTASGNVILLREAYPSALPKINEFPEINLADLDKFIITDADRYSQTLYVSNIDINTAMVDINLELPPLFTELNFDSRFEYNEFVKRVSADSGTIDLSILVHTNSFPINITWEINPANGISYSFINDSIPGKISNISVIGEKSFSNLDNNKIRLLASVGKTNSSDHLPKEFSLEQNYPNPFNPKTVIGYQLPVTGNVTLKVYDVLGSEVATLVDEFLEAGRYEATFDAGKLASGIYIYELRAGTFSQSKKMILAK